MSDKDLVQRGVYGSSPLGTTIFVGLRALDGFVLQRALQVLNPLPSLLTRYNLASSPIPAAPTGGPLLSMSSHDLSPFQAVLWGLAVGSSLKHIFWVLFTAKEKMSPGAATIIALFNSVLNSVNTFAFSLAAINPTWSESQLYAAVPLFVTGILIENVAEQQRKRFKDDPRNAGKPYSGGLFGYARSINYFGYTVWRGAMAMAAGGWVWGAVCAAFFSWDFVNRAIPEMDRYCSKRYGAQWTEVKRKVPYGFMPGVI